MSRIHEALQRAELNRNYPQEPEVEQFGETTFSTCVEEPPTAAANVILGRIALRPWMPSATLLPTLGDRGEAVEQFRGLRSHIYQFRDQAPLKTILVSSGMPAEGKTFVAANLAISLARNNRRRILLIDGDLRRPAIHRLLGTSNTPGLVDYLAGTAELTAVMQRNGASETDAKRGVRNISNLTFIPAGDCDDNSLELVGNHRMEELVASVSGHFDWIVIDSPPVLAVSDAVDLARAADAVLLVARGASTPFDIAKQAQAAFSNSRILGFVLNAVKDAPRGRNYYNYYGRP